MDQNVTLHEALRTLLRVQQSILEQTTDAWEDAPYVFWQVIAEIIDGGFRDEDTPSDLILQIAMIRSKNVPLSRRHEEAINWLRHLGNVLMDKNDSYGGAVADPVCCFSDFDAVSQCESRIDAKISRLFCGGTGLDREDTLLDLAGYLALLSGLESQLTDEEFEDVTDCWEPTGDTVVDFDIPSDVEPDYDAQLADEDDELVFHHMPERTKFVPNHKDDDTLYEVDALPFGRETD